MTAMPGGSTNTAKNHLRLLRIDEVAARLNLGRSPVYLLAARGELPTIRFGRAVRVPEDALERFVEEQTHFPRTG